jgi:hypothetical protein
VSARRRRLRLRGALRAAAALAAAAEGRGRRPAAGPGRGGGGGGDRCRVPSLCPSHPARVGVLLGNTLARPLFWCRSGPQPRATTSAAQQSGHWVAARLQGSKWGQSAGQWGINQERGRASVAVGRCEEGPPMRPCPPAAAPARRRPAPAPAPPPPRPPGRWRGVCSRSPSAACQTWPPASAGRAAPGTCGDVGRRRGSSGGRRWERGAAAGAAGGGVRGSRRRAAHQWVPAGRGSRRSGVRARAGGRGGWRAGAGRARCEARLRHRKARPRPAAGAPHHSGR